MRILKVVQSYYPFQEKGGTAVKVRALARGLAQRGHNLTVLTADLGFRSNNVSGLKVESCTLGWRAQEDQVEAIYLTTVGRYRSLSLNPRVAAFCRASLKEFDLVHFYGLYDLLAPAVSYFCRRNGIPYVIEPMGMYRPIVRSVPLKQLYHRILGRPLVGGARFLIATSQLEKQELEESGIASSRIVIRRNGVDLPERLPARGEFRRQWGIRKDARIILFLGRLVSKKSPDLLLDAFAHWRGSASEKNDAVLVLAGPEENDGFGMSLRRMAHALGLDQNIRFVGPLYDDAKWQAYRDADVFVLPSQNENFGNTAAEAAGCGTPVIVTDQCGIASFIGQAGLVIPYGSRELVEALAQLLEDREMRQRCQKACAEMARALSWSDPLQQMEELYERCLMKGIRR